MNKEIQLPAFSPEAFHRKLDLLRSAVNAKSPKTTQYLQEGLTEAQIKERSSWFPAPLPPEIISLYKWRNGFTAPSGSNVVPFQFRDYTFTPLESVQSDYRSMLDTYGKEPATARLLAGSFPFAALGGGWLVLPTEPAALEPRLERPVISVFQGVSVFFYSVEKMAETCTAWFSHPKHDGFSIRPREEMEVWQQVNPGIFSR